MKIAVIGGSGHIGTYLVPRLVRCGHEVTVVSRGLRSPYTPDPAWEKVTFATLDRKATEPSGTFGAKIRDLRAEVVIDLTCFTPESARQLVDALRGTLRLFLHCGTIWVHGYSTVVPATEDLPRKPFCEYGKRKAAIEQFLLEEAQSGRFPAAILHPGHIVGKGWAPLNPAGHFHPRVFSQLAQGEELCLPNLGMETVHHVHADDVAQSFERAVEMPERAIAESFHVVSEKALTLRGYAEAMSAWFGQAPRLRFLPWAEWTNTVSEREAAYTWDHIAHSPNCSIEKARTKLGYSPGYTSLEAVQESVSDSRPL
jgi:nucleoside-diphosphate-sugar epimerase